MPRPRADTCGDPMRWTRKAIDSSRSADGIDTVMGTMPCRPLPALFIESKEAKRHRLSAPQCGVFPCVVRKGEPLRTKSARPPITADNCRRRVYRTRCGLVGQSYGWRAFRSVSSALGPRVDGARGGWEGACLSEIGRASSRELGSGSYRTRKILSAESGGEVRSRGHESH